MSNTKLNGEDPAFGHEGGQNNGMQPYSGLTIREYFAAKALQGLVVNSGRNSLDFERPKDAAVIAVKHADALIDALNQNATQETAG